MVSLPRFRLRERTSSWTHDLNSVFRPPLAKAFVVDRRLISSARILPLDSNGYRWIPRTDADPIYTTKIQQGNRIMRRNGLDKARNKTLVILTVLCDGYIETLNLVSAKHASENSTKTCDAIA
jgi:hypothetical protein